jgi:PAS domain S-box-containing protein
MTLQEKQALFASIEHSPIATLITDPNQPDNPAVAVNEAFCRLTGYSREEVLGRNCRFLAGPGTEPAGRQALRSAVEAGRPILQEVLNYRRDGTPFRNAVLIAPLFDDDGKLTFFVGSQLEVTDSQREDRHGRASALVQRLTRRQLEVLREMAQGYRNKQIAQRLAISEKTVKMHRAAMLNRLGTRTSADAVRIAVEAGL